MQVFKTYFKVSKKHLGAFFIYTTIFIVLLSVFVAQRKEESDPAAFQSSKIKVSIFDHDQSDLSTSLVSFISENHNIVKIDEDLKSIRDKMYIRDVEYVLIIPEGFEKKLTSTDIDPSYGLEAYKFPGSVSATFIQSQINSFLNIYSSYTILGYDANTANEKTLETLSLETEANVSAALEEKISVPHIYYTIICYILVSVIVMCIAPIIIVFNKEELKNRTNLSCVSQVKRNLSIAAASLIFTLLIFLLFTVISFFMAGNEMKTGIGALRILNTFVNSIVCLSFAFMIATFVTNENQLTFIANFFGLASSFLCGVFVGREFLGKAVVNFSKILPAYWYMDVEIALSKYNHISQFTESTTRTLTYGYVIQILFAIVMFSVGMVISKSRKSA